MSVEVRTVQPLNFKSNNLQVQNKFSIVTLNFTKKKLIFWNLVYSTDYLRIKYIPMDLNHNHRFHIHWI